MTRRPDRILIVDDDDGIRTALSRLLRAHHYDVSLCDTAAAAEAAVLNTAPDLVLLDLRLPDGDGSELITLLLGARPGLALVVLTGHGSVDAAVAAIKRGADHFLTKPVDGEALLLVIERVLEEHRNQQRKLAARPRTEDQHTWFRANPALAELAQEAERVRDTDLPVLVLGETGTGKGVLARWLHETGPRAEGPFVDLNCAGISRELLDTELFGHQAGAFTGAVKAKQGLLEVAHGGTLFLDEIGDMDPGIQARLLKVLEEKRFRRLGDVRDRSVDVRLIAATHQNLEELMKVGRFRQDLYFRICSVELRLPPLRARPEDIAPLALDLLGRFAREVGRPAPALSPSALEALRSYPWPGNIRELRNVLEAAALRCAGVALGPEHLRLRGPTESRGARSTDPPAEIPTLEQAERAHVASALAASGGHVARAARLLGISASSLYDRIRRFRLEAAPTEPPSGEGGRRRE